SWRPLHLRWLALAVALALVLVWWAANRPTRSTGNHVAKFSSISFSPVGDAYVSYVRPSVNLGTVPVLRTSSRQKIRCYLPFSVSGLLCLGSSNSPTRSTGNHVAKFSSISFSPVGDAYVSYVRPSVNLGTVPVLRTSSRPKIRSYLTFSVAGLPGIVTRATLRLWSNV